MKTVAIILFPRRSWYKHVHKSRAPWHVATKFFYGGAKYLWILSVEHTSCHPFDAWNFEVTLEDLGTPGYRCTNIRRMKW